MNVHASLVASGRAHERPRSALIDRDRLDADIAAIAAAHPADPDAMRIAAVERFKRAHDDGRAMVRAWLDRDGRGRRCARDLSYLQDELIRSIHTYVTTFVHPLPFAPSERVAIVAVGGYGRGKLAPHSDIDLLFLLPTAGRERGERVVEAMLYVLWDLKQKVGHSARTIAECLAQAQADMTVRTALLEARLILGHERHFEDLQARFDSEIVKGSAREFVAAKLAERDARMFRPGASRYVVEPNVKEGKGGLRDLNTLFWVCKYTYRVQRLEDFVAAGVFSAQEERLFRRCDAFLWRVRCHLHFLAGRAEERLSFDFQPAVAEKLGYTARAGRANAVERFMKQYFLVAKNVGDLTRIVCSALEERQVKTRPVLDRVIGRLRRKGRTLPERDFAVEFDRLTVSALDVFERDPVNLLRLFAIADREGLPIHPDATRLVTHSLKRIDAKLRADPIANRLFLDILTSRNTPEIVLRLMNEAGVLGRFIPDFGHIVATMQFNMYHHYTVDEHLLRAVGILSAIESGRLTEDHPLSAEILPSIANRTALYVATFLHDVAKGRNEDHSEKGAQIARSLCPRLGLSEAETDTVAWLVESHLVMSDTAQRRDLADFRTILTFADTVQTLERLRMLLVLTVCDIRAVGPGVWNGWKGQLLRTLYWETEVVLSGGHSSMDRQQRVTLMQQELRRALPAWSDADFSLYAARHYQAYWLKVDLPRRVRHAALLRDMDKSGDVLRTEVATDAFSGSTELTVVAPDHPRLLSIITGACAAAGANIADAQIFTTSDGFALDTIMIERAFERDEDELRRAGRIADAIEKGLQGRIRLSEIVAAKGMPKNRAKTFVLAPEVVIDNSLSGRHTVIEVSGLDRPGLLFDLTAALAKLNLNIGSAHVVTYGEKAVDAFYVTDLTGAKVMSTARHATIRRELLDVLNPGEAGAARSRSATSRRRPRALIFELKSRYRPFPTRTREP